MSRRGTDWVGLVVWAAPRASRTVGYLEFVVLDFLPGLRPAVNWLPVSLLDYRHLPLWMNSWLVWPFAWLELGACR